ncbi:hypothetical protein DSO57_1014320 [Entomophthora muscae]|uniref:Uncharacterized protein n=1 Tax=Entomophthora muscae TaxID=34485 RepID=A0ACC2SII7_9FUNG|nr:hypothetical protein DSO57_1014320 [Entomophthora muscae]
MKLLLLVALLPLTLANVCYGRGACIFDFQQTQAFISFTRDLQIATTNSDAINKYKEISNALFDLYKAKDTYERANYTMAYDYITKSHDFVRNLLQESYSNARNRLIAIYDMRKHDYKNQDLVRHEYRVSDIELHDVLSKFMGETTEIRNLKVTEIRERMDEIRARVRTLEDEELQSEREQLALEHRDLEMHEVEDELTKRDELRRKNSIIPYDPRGQITKKDKEYLLRMKHMMDKIKVPGPKKIEVLDNEELDQYS